MINVASAELANVIFADATNIPGFQIPGSRAQKNCNWSWHI